MPFRLRVTQIILLTLLAAPLLLPLVWPVPPLEGTQSHRELAGPDATFVTWQDVELHARIAGGDSAATDEAPASLGAAFVHGFGSNLVSFRDVQDRLADAGVRSVAWDRPAFGLTERVTQWRGLNPYAAQAQVDQTVRMLDAAGLDNAVLVGHSAGAPIAINTALAHPDRVAALVLIGPAVYTGGGTPGWLRPLLFTPQMERIGPLLMRQLAGTPGRSLVESGYADPDKVTPEVLAAYEQATQVDGWDEALWALVQASETPNVEGALASLELPVLVIAGREDALVPFEDAERVAAALPNAGLVALDACGHVPQEECADATADALEAFVFRVSQGR